MAGANGVLFASPILSNISFDIKRCDFIGLLRLKVMSGHLILAFVQNRQDCLGKFDRSCELFANDFQTSNKCRYTNNWATIKALEIQQISSCKGDVQSCLDRK